MIFILFSTGNHSHTRANSNIHHHSNNQVQGGSRLNGQVLLRPPHSHRFSPPTQWTQV